MKARPQRKARTFLSDAVDMVSMCTRALESDNFSLCFRPVHRFKLYKSGVLYIFSFITRYFILFPIRLTVLFAGGTFIAACFLYGVYVSNEQAVSYSFMLFFRLFIIVFNCHISHHGEKRRLHEPHIYVANHTSFIDFLILSSHRFCHACISESHGGLFGFVFSTILSKNGSIAFKRSDKNDREDTLRRVKEHIQKNGAPMLIFPEGTVVNNEYVVMFQKGAFELDVAVCPVGIRYKKKLMDPYWNRRDSCFTMHLLYLMTRWRIDADVYWLEPVRRMRDENAVEFSHRVKNVIAKRISLNNTLWNGYFKSASILKDRMLFKTAYRNIYRKQQKCLLDEDRVLDAENGYFYLLDESIDYNSGDERAYLEGITYDSFINECCKEYLRLKATSGVGLRKSVELSGVGAVNAA